MVLNRCGCYKGAFLHSALQHVIGYYCGVSVVSKCFIQPELRFVIGCHGEMVVIMRLFTQSELQSAMVLW